MGFPPEKDHVVKPFDLFMAGNILHEYNELFDSLTKQCAESFEQELADFVQADISVSGSSIVEKKTINAQCNTTYYKNWVTVNNSSNAYALIYMRRDALGVFLNTVCGGKHQDLIQQATDSRSSSAEEKLLSRLGQMLFKSMESVFEPVAKLSMAMVQNMADMTNAERANSPFEQYIATDIFTLKLGHHQSEIRIEYSVSLLKEALREKNSSSKILKRAQLKDSLLRICLPVTASIAMGRMKFTDVQNIRPGDTLPLDDISAVDVHLGGKKVFNADIVTKNDQLAVKLKG